MPNTYCPPATSTPRSLEAQRADWIERITRTESVRDEVLSADGRLKRRRDGRQGWQEGQGKEQTTAADETETGGAKEAGQGPAKDMSEDAHARPTRDAPEPLYDVNIPTPTHAERARTLVAQISTGTLCTLALEPEGYPYGSFVTVAFDNGDPIFLISELAEHTKNLERDPRASLLVAEGGSDDPLANGRVTMLGPCTRVDGDGGRARAAFLMAHPNAAYYADFGDFAFWKLRADHVRYI